MTNHIQKYIGYIIVVLFAVFFGIVLLRQSKNIEKQNTILFVIGDNKAEALIKAIDLFYLEFPAIASQIEVIIRTRSNTDNGHSPIPPCDVMLVRIFETPILETHLEYIKQANSGIRKIGKPYVRIAMGPAAVKYPIESLEKIGMQVDQTVNEYLKNESPEELQKLLAYIAHRYLGYKEVPILPPSKVISSGFLVLDENNKFYPVETWDEWLQNQKPNNLKSKIAVFIYESTAKEGLLNIEREIYKAIEEKGYQPVIIFGYPPGKSIKNTILDTVFLQNKGIDAAISWFYKFPDNDTEVVLNALGIPIINAIDIYGYPLDEWQISTKGLSSTEIAWQIAIPELAGLISPTVVGGSHIVDGIPYKKSIQSRVNRIVNRAVRFSELQKKANFEKKLAILYWNYPPGKDNMGASYLNIFESFPVILDLLQKNGYQTNGFQKSMAPRLQSTLKERGRNIGSYAPGSLQSLVDGGNAELISIKTYKNWFSQLSPMYQKQINDHWGSPEDSDIMTIQKNGEKYIVLPVVKYGNIYFMPQADRARTQDLAALYHSQTLPPHHQYICQYLWMQQNVDAVIHTGTHGTHEWLEGKETGLSDHDSPEVLAGDLPILYIYNMDVVGEGIQAKRRGAATIIDHLTPALGEAGLSPELIELKNLISQWSITQSVNPEGATGILDRIDKTAEKYNIYKDLEKNGWSLSHRLTKVSSETSKKMIDDLSDFIEKIRKRATPFGMHIFGISPSIQKLEKFAEMIAQVNGVDRKNEFSINLTRSGPNELESLLHGLNGRYIPPQVGNDPIRSPNAIPTGKNFYTFDPRTVPLPYADSVGIELANQYIIDHQKTHGSMPKKVAFEVFAVETIRHQGVQEAQILALLGVRIIRNKRGQVESLELIPREELGRPRVDILMSSTGLYRDVFPMLFELIDEAVQLAAKSPEADNPVRRHSEELRLELIRAGVADQEASRRSQIRIFAEPSGMYGSKIAEAVISSGSWEEESQIAKLYIRRMGNGYGNGFWGESMETEFKASLKNIDAVIHSRSSSLYMSLDNDDFFSFAGAITMGARYASDYNNDPPMLVADLHIPGSEEITPIEKYMGQELRSRYFNPSYIIEMQKEGYAGARHIMQGVEYLWGWQVVYPNVVNANKWQEFYEVWLKDKYELNTNDFLEKESPFAKQTIAATMLEAIRKEYWNATESVRNDLVKTIITSVTRHGESCNHLICDHPELIYYIKGIGETNQQIAEHQIKKFIQIIENATQTSIQEALQKRKENLIDFANDKPTERQKSLQNKAQNKTTKIKGYKMEETIVSNEAMDPSNSNDFIQAGVRWFLPLMLGIFAFCFLTGGFVQYQKK
jgi:cobaltochelatase CobN